MSGELYKDIVVLDTGGTSISISHISNNVIADTSTTISSKQLCVSNAGHAMAGIIKNYVALNKLDLSVVVIGIPGMLDRGSDTISHCNNIPQIEGSGLGQLLESLLACRVILEQDIMLQLLGEWRSGSAQACDSVFGVYFGTGIGSAFLTNGKPHGDGKKDLQAGHIPVMAEGKKCLCGNTDCIEAYASGHTLTELARTSGCPVDQLFENRHNPEFSDQLATPLERFILFQAYMLSTIVTLLMPDMILIGGGIPLMKQYPGNELIAKTRRHLQRPHPADTVDIQWATLGKQAPLYGALVLLERH